MSLKTRSLNSIPLSKLEQFSFDFHFLTTPMLALFVVPVLLIMAFTPSVSGTALPAQSLSSEASFAMSTSGALTLYLNDAEVSCSNNAISFTMPASSGLSGYQLALATPINLSQQTKPAIIDLNQTNVLTLQLTNAQQTAYRSFEANQGQVSLNAQGNGTMNAFLFDEQGQQVFLNASWTCAN